MKKLAQRITSDPETMLGKPCIEGTRITVELILRWLAAERSRDELLEAYPHLTSEDISAALEFAAKQLGHFVPEAAE
jgi:uncharacterized protein (DUF433 family)